MEHVARSLAPTLSALEKGALLPLLPLCVREMCVHKCCIQPGLLIVTKSTDAGSALSVLRACEKSPAHDEALREGTDPSWLSFSREILSTLLPLSLNSLELDSSGRYVTSTSFVEQVILYTGSSGPQVETTTPGMCIQLRCAWIQYSYRGAFIAERPASGERVMLECTRGRMTFSIRRNSRFLFSRAHPAAAC